MSRPLIITPQRKEAIRKFLDVANQEDHWFYPGKSDWIPGDHADHIFQFETYRAVYTCSIIEGKPHRHITVSILSIKLPNPVAVFTIAKLFGFTGGTGPDSDVITKHGRDWKIATSPIGDGRECIMVAQEIYRNQGMVDVFRKLYGPASENPDA